MELKMMVRFGRWYPVIMLSLICLYGRAGAVECSGKALPKEAGGSYAELQQVVQFFRMKDKAALSNRGGRFILIRRYVSGEAAIRGGNIREELPLDSVSDRLTISYHGQVIVDFTVDPVFSDLDTSRVVRVRGRSCSHDGLCGPASRVHSIDLLLAELLKCNGSKKGVFELDDSFVVLDMVLAEGLAIGEGIVLRKDSGHKLPMTLIISQ